MLTGPAVTAKARELQKAANERIQQEYDHWSPYEVGLRVEQICEELFRGEWDYRMLEAIGQCPAVIITSYRGTFV